MVLKSLLPLNDPFFLNHEPDVYSKNPVLPLHKRTDFLLAVQKNFSKKRVFFSKILSLPFALHFL